MFKLALITLISATTITNGATAAFHVAQNGALQTASVYAAAAQVFDNAGDAQAFNTANANLYAAGAQLQSWSNYAQDQYAN